MKDVQDIDECGEAEARRLLATAFETAPAGGGLAGHGLAGHRLAGHGLAGAELLRGVRRRTSSRQRRARALVPAGAVAALGGAAAVAVTLTATVASAPSAFAAVTAAAGKTATQSFRVTAENYPATGHGPGGAAGPAPSMRITGEFAPSRGLGKELIRNHAGTYHLLFVGKDVYLHSVVPNFSVAAKPWVEGKAWPQTVSESVTSPQFDARESADPGALLGLLESAGTVTNEGPASGPGWTGTTYGFTVTTPHGYRTAAGTVSVDSQGLVRRMLTTFTYVVLGGPPRTFTQDVTFSDFGTAVSVSAPPASQVLRTNGYILLPAPLPAPGAKS